VPGEIRHVNLDGTGGTSTVSMGGDPGWRGPFLKSIGN